MEGIEMSNHVNNDSSIRAHWAMRQISDGNEYPAPTFTKTARGIEMMYDAKRVNSHDLELAANNLVELGEVEKPTDYIKLLQTRHVPMADVLKAPQFQGMGPSSKTLPNRNIEAYNEALKRSGI